MLDKEIVLNNLQQVLQTIDLIENRVSGISDANDFYTSQDGMLKLDAICMNLIAIGEVIKNTDKLSEGKLLSNYDGINWKGVMKMRDKIAHHYFETDADVVLLTIREDIPKLKQTVKQIIVDIENRIV